VTGSSWSVAAGIGELCGRAVEYWVQEPAP